ncbi:MAG: Crp/Fnr family transcriptional regulator [Sphingomonas bacterium]|uniref:Crp/Fnr family transcriptional regulator n=1 Tax=Sphingomonas bacterium TaxID=1895847 RepID=UPI002606E180|nr:Crp/Fnr family transcriptional regulator [Sphingomonas bacterium]MDB5710796.1 Crp/Fnr family transcriptional regulator [Sphingomonas bacterium]
MQNPWTMKMEQFTAFSDMEKRRLDELIRARQDRHAPKEDIIADGAHSGHCHVVLSGLACRYKLLPDGRRQIMAFLIPGDLCDAEIFILKVMDHGVAAVTPTTTALIPAEAMKALLRETSSLGEALWWGTMTDLGVLRERIIDEGRRSAYRRIAHLLYEMLVRYRMVGMTVGNGFVFPITQNDLADATGLTPVHANRMLQKLRADGLIRLGGGVLTVLDPDRLKDAAQFNGAYLHLDRVHDRTAVGQRAGDLV